MFLKFCVTNALEDFIKINGLNAETITLFDRGAIDSFMPVIKQRQLDAKKGAMLVISGTIIKAAQSGVLLKLQEETPDLYQDLESLWHFCNSLLKDDKSQWGDVILWNDVPEHTFHELKQCA